MTRPDAASHRRAATSPAGGLLTALRVLAGLSMLTFLYMGATAGEIFSQAQPWLFLHGVGAIVLHVLTGLTAAAALLVQRSTGGSMVPVVVAGTVFVLTFVQALLGTLATLWMHIPLALLLLLSLAWVLSWSFSPARR
ncbi:MAG: hypothetical protein AB7J32_00230 [Pseudonocardia sp.]